MYLLELRRVIGALSLTRVNLFVYVLHIRNRDLLKANGSLTVLRNSIRTIKPQAVLRCRSKMTVVSPRVIGFWAAAYPLLQPATFMAYQVMHPNKNAGSPDHALRVDLHMLIDQLDQLLESSV